MDARRELLYHIGSLLVLNVLLAFGAIGLFVRMGPAIGNILEDNVYSIVAAEDILAVMAQPRPEGSSVFSRNEREDVMSAIERARNNVTEDAEVPVLDRIERELPRALDGDTEARRALAGQLQVLIQVNREAMVAVDREAQRLGRAGAWSAVVVGFVSLVLSLIVLARLRSRLLLPLVEIRDVLLDAQSGGRRRCRPRPAPLEVRRIAEMTNRLLDERGGAFRGVAGTQR